MGAACASAGKQIVVLPPVAVGKTRICVAGFGLSHHTNRAGRLARTIAARHPDRYESWFYADSKGYRLDLLPQVISELGEEQRAAFAGHSSSPFCWLEQPNLIDAKGGRDRLCEWALSTFPEDATIVSLASSEPSPAETWEAPSAAPPASPCARDRPPWAAVLPAAAALGLGAASASGAVAAAAE